jgi:DNA polymerase-3 subunit beta
MIFKDGVFSLTGEELLTAIKKVNYASKKKALNERFSNIGVFINVNDIEFMASNGHRIAVYTLNLDDENSEDINNDLIDTNYPISQNTVKELLKKVKKKDIVKIEFNSDNVIFESKNFKIIEKVNTFYPHYTEVIPSEYTNTVKIYKSDLINALNQIENKPYKSNEVGNYTCLKLTFDSINEKLIITPYLSDLKFEIDITVNDYYDDLMNIYINDKYLSEAISQIEGGAVIIRYINNDEPIEILPNNNYEELYKAYIMPMDCNF